MLRQQPQHQHAADPCAWCTLAVSHGHTEITVQSSNSTHDLTTTQSTAGRVQLNQPCLCHSWQQKTGPLSDADPLGSQSRRLTERTQAHFQKIKCLTTMLCQGTLWLLLSWHASRRAALASVQHILPKGRHANSAPASCLQPESHRCSWDTREPRESTACTASHHSSHHTHLTLPCYDNTASTPTQYSAQTSAHTSHNTTIRVRQSAVYKLLPKPHCMLGVSCTHTHKQHTLGSR